MHFSRNNSYTGTAITTSSDSEDSFDGCHNSNSTSNNNTNNFARAGIEFTPANTMSISPPFHTSAQHHTMSTSPPQLDLTSPKSPPRPPTRPHRRIPHTIIERRYRDNLNTSIETLRLTIPSLKDAYNTPNSPPDLEDAALPPRLPSKAVIIGTAAVYIKELQAQQRRKDGEMEVLRNQVVELQKLVQCNDCSILQYLQQVGAANAGGQGQQGQMVG
jgi:hypothetical protein